MRCQNCGTGVTYDGLGAWVDETDGDGCLQETPETDTHRPHQDPAFYVDGEGWQEVWRDAEQPRFFVVRNGEMRVLSWAKGEDSDNPTIFRYSDTLDGYGVTTDAELIALENQGEEVWEWGHNAWFEVWDANDPYGEDISNVYHSLDDAVAICHSFSVTYGAHDPVTEINV